MNNKVEKLINREQGVKYTKKKKKWKKKENSKKMNKETNSDTIFERNKLKRNEKISEEGKL